MKKIIMLILSLIIVTLSLNTVMGFGIVTPIEGSYNTTEILLSIEHNETMDSISYSIESTEMDGCFNCSSFETILNLSEGEYTIEALGIIENITYEDEVEIDIDIEEEEIETDIDFELIILSPLAQDYNVSTILIEIESNETLDELSLDIDGNLEILCTDCSYNKVNKTFTEDIHILTVWGTLGEITKNQTVEFNVFLEGLEFSLDIVSPEEKTYSTPFILINVSSNMTLDKIEVNLGDLSFECENCSYILEELNLTNGDYDLLVYGFLQETTIEKSIEFEVDYHDDEDEDDNDDEDDEEDDEDDNEDEEDNDDEDDESAEKNESLRFSQGLSKLPKLYDSGELTDLELASIIRNNKLNPGVINRLIKSGKLENESINAILDTQAKPSGIFRKLLSLIGIKQKSYAEDIYESYNISDSIKKNLLKRNDVSKKYIEKIGKELKEKQSEKSEKINSGSGKTLNIGNQKKADTEFPPGFSKKNSNEKSGKGNGKNKG